MTPARNSVIERIIKACLPEGTRISDWWVTNEGGVNVSDDQTFDLFKISRKWQRRTSVFLSVKRNFNVYVALGRYFPPTEPLTNLNDPNSLDLIKKRLMRDVWGGGGDD